MGPRVAQGWLTKLGQFRKNWRHRWFMVDLNDMLLKYFSGKDAKKEKAYVPIDEVLRVFIPKTSSGVGSGPKSLQKHHNLLMIEVGWNCAALLKVVHAVMRLARICVVDLVAHVLLGSCHARGSAALAHRPFHLHQPGSEDYRRVERPLLWPRNAAACRFPALGSRSNPWPPLSVLFGWWHG